MWRDSLSVVSYDKTNIPSPNVHFFLAKPLTKASFLPLATHHTKTTRHHNAVQRGDYICKYGCLITFKKCSSTNQLQFGAGPALLPTTVLEGAAQALINFDNTGLGVCYGLLRLMATFLVLMIGLDCRTLASLTDCQHHHQRSQGRSRLFPGHPRRL